MISYFVHKLRLNIFIQHYFKSAYFKFPYNTAALN